MKNAVIKNVLSSNVGLEIQKRKIQQLNFNVKQQ